MPRLNIFTHTLGAHQRYLAALTRRLSTHEGAAHVRKGTNTILRVVCLDISGNAKSARFPVSLSIGVGALIVSVTICAENPHHGKPARSCRILAIRKKSQFDSCCMAEF